MRQKMKKGAMIFTLIVGGFAWGSVFAKTPNNLNKHSDKEPAICPLNLPEGGCGEYIEGYLNGKADRGVGERNVFVKQSGTDAYELGYERGWRNGRRWE
jgi:hypothetical protein